MKLFGIFLVYEKRFLLKSHPLDPGGAQYQIGIVGDKKVRLVYFCLFIEDKDFHFIAYVEDLCVYVKVTI